MEESQGRVHWIHSQLQQSSARLLINHDRTQNGLKRSLWSRVQISYLIPVPSASIDRHDMNLCHQRHELDAWTPICRTIVSLSCQSKKCISINYWVIRLQFLSKSLMLRQSSHLFIRSTSMFTANVTQHFLHNVWSESRVLSDIYSHSIIDISTNFITYMYVLDPLCREQSISCLGTRFFDTDDSHSARSQPGDRLRSVGHADQHNKSICGALLKANVVKLITLEMCRVTRLSFKSARNCLQKNKGTHIE